MSHVLHINESWAAYEWIIKQQIGYKWVMSHTWMSHEPMSHVPHINESWAAYEWIIRQQILAHLDRDQPLSMIHWYVGHALFVCETWLTHMWDMTGAWFGNRQILAHLDRDQPWLRSGVGGDGGRTGGVALQGMWVYVRTHIHAALCTHRCMYISLHAYMYTCIYVHMCICIYVYIHVYMYVYKLIHA